MYVAIVTGATGQDGSYMCEHLVSKGYDVKCLVRKDVHYDTVECYHGDILDYSTVYNLISKCVEYERIEIYNLAAKVHTGSPLETFEVNTSGIHNILEAVKHLNIQSKCRICQASSSEMFGNVREVPQNENTPFHPRTVYGVSKVAAHWLVRNYRESNGLYVCSAILYNHESPRRSDIYVTQKIVRGLKLGECFHIGNLESRRDWGHAKDYVEAMWLMLQPDTPDDYVIATGTTHSVRDFIEIVATKMCKNISWSGEGVDEVGIIDGKIAIKVSKDFYRPCEEYPLVGDPSKILSIGWSRRYDIHSIVDDMLDSIH
jgi:GDPmannose 4,6-dehydratase